MASFCEKVEAKTSDVLKQCRYFTLAGFLSLFISGIFLGFCLAYNASENLFFKDARVIKLMEYEKEVEATKKKYLRQISTIEAFEKRGVKFYKDVILAPPKILENIGTSESGDQGIWLKPEKK